MRFPINYYSSRVQAVFRFLLQTLFQRVGFTELDGVPSETDYYSDLLQGVQDACEYLKIDLERFNEYYLSHVTWPRELWEGSGEDPGTFNRQLVGEYGRANVCANVVCSFAFRPGYDTISRFIKKRRDQFGKVIALDYGCGNANISFALLRRGLIDELVLCDFYSESTEYIRFRSRKHNLESRIQWLDIDAMELSGQFDVVLCMDVLEHVPHSSQLLKEVLFPRLKPAGWMILHAPWNGPHISHIDQAVIDFYSNGGKKFLGKNLRRISSMNTLDIAGVWKRI